MDVIKQIFGSKKAIAGMVAALVNLVIGFLPADTIDLETKKYVIGALTGLVGCYLLAQGRADQGKEAAKVAAGPVADAPAKDDATADAGSES
jgi:hypothetical protein